MTWYPHLCILCSTPLQGALSLCRDCEEELPWQPPACVQCGILIPRGTTVKGTPGDRLCIDCLQTPPTFDTCQILFEYCSPVQELISAFKFNERFAIGRVCGELLAQAFQRYYEGQPFPQLLLPVPMHRSRLQRRGFNQAIELVRHVSRFSRIPVNIQHCLRSRSTPTQRGLNVAARELNVRDAFTVRSGHPFTAKCVAIIDDVVTTTATVNELSRTIRLAGAETIHVWALARVN